MLRYSLFRNKTNIYQHVCTILSFDQTYHTLLVREVHVHFGYMHSKLITSVVRRAIEKNCTFLQKMIAEVKHNKIKLFN